jgi:hypothetical protein
MYGKVFQHAHWRSIWLPAFEALSTADVLVVVGSSLIETDYHMQALLRRVVRRRRAGSRPFAKAIFVDRVKVRRRWRRVLQGVIGSHVEHKTFEAFLSKELKG